MRSFLGVPVAVRGRSIGNLYLTDKQDAPGFSDSDRLLVEMFALRAGIAIENARLHEQVQRLAIVEERERISRDLHDGIIQTIYGVALSLEDVPAMMAGDQDEAGARVDRAIDSLNLAIREIRNFILGLRSELLHGADVIAGMATLAEEFADERPGRRRTRPGGRSRGDRPAADDPSRPAAADDPRGAQQRDPPRPCDTHPPVDAGR